MSSRNVDDIQSQTCKPPAIFWRDRANQFMAYIGYHEATKGRSKGKRFRTAHYLGRDQREATLNAILIDRRWDKVVAETKHRAKRAACVTGASTRRVLPVWPTEQQKLVMSATAEQLEDMGLLVHLSFHQHHASGEGIGVPRCRGYGVRR